MSSSSANNNEAAATPLTNVYRALWAAEDERQQQLKQQLRALQFACGVVRDDEYGSLHGAQSHLFTEQRQVREQLCDSMRASLMYAAWEKADPAQVLCQVLGREVQRGREVLLEKTPREYQLLVEVAYKYGTRLTDIVRYLRQLKQDLDKAAEKRADVTPGGYELLAWMAVRSLFESEIRRAPMFSQFEPLVASVTGLSIDELNEPMSAKAATTKAIEGAPVQKEVDEEDDE
jgi:hypothetical protein